VGGVVIAADRSNLSAYLTPRQVVFLRSGGRRGAIRELVQAACRAAPLLDPEATFAAVWDRESVVSSWIAPGIAMPHARLKGFPGFLLLIGRSVKGVNYESPDGEPVHVVAMILGNAAEVDRHLELLAETARSLQPEETRRRIIAARTRREIWAVLTTPPAEPTAAAAAVDPSRLMVNHAVWLAREISAGAVILHLDAAADPASVAAVESDVPIILVVRDAELLPPQLKGRHPVLELPLAGLTRANHVSLTLIVALSRGLIDRESRVVSLFGMPGSGRLDTIVVIDVAREFPSVLASSPTGLLGDVRLEVLERVLQIAAELGREGREAKPVGMLFVLGDYEKVRGWTHQMVMNPFKGYRDEEKNILDPSLAETVKEFSTIDGAFLVRGDGVIEAAGAFLRTGKQAAESVPGLGARHAAAAGVTARTAALAIALSQSTGRVTLFAAGKLVMQLDRAGG
jgi:diadenylate cyclase